MGRAETRVGLKRGLGRNRRDELHTPRVECIVFARNEGVQGRRALQCGGVLGRTFRATPHIQSVSPPGDVSPDVQFRVAHATTHTPPVQSVSERRRGGRHGRRTLRTDDPHTPLIQSVSKRRRGVGRREGRSGRAEETPFLPLFFPYRHPSSKVYTARNGALSSRKSGSRRAVTVYPNPATGSRRRAPSIRDRSTALSRSTTHPSSRV